MVAEQVRQRTVEQNVEMVTAISQACVPERIVMVSRTMFEQLCRGPNSMNYAEKQRIEQRYTETVHGEIKKRTETICYDRKEVDPSS